MVCKSYHDIMYRWGIVYRKVIQHTSNYLKLRAFGFSIPLKINPIRALWIMIILILGYKAFKI